MNTTNGKPALWLSLFLVACYLLIAALILTGMARWTPRPACTSTLIATRGDSTFYEVVCTGGAVPR